jgi:hypothetical protein
VSVMEKVQRLHQVRIKKTNNREPSFKCRKHLDDIETGEVMLLRDESGGNLFTGQVVSGIEAASVWFGLPC